MHLPDPPSPPPQAALPDPAHLLFAYGTLMLTTGIPEVDAALRNAGTSLGRGWIHGRLFDLGEYPGAVAALMNAGAAGADTVAAGKEAGAASPVSEAADATVDEDAPKVWGRLMHLKDPAAFYSVIDRYEGFDAGDPAGSEFVRARTEVFLPGMDRGVSCQVYWYNLPTQGRPEIPAGDYLAYWQSRGKPTQGRIVS
jgi:gamma-glutamylcyclotransferase (GGCT)/AIG2-like uncharacterized protein YtfP